jgi:hypothetical protein
MNVLLPCRRQLFSMKMAASRSQRGQEPTATRIVFPDDPHLTLDPSSKLKPSPGLRLLEKPKAKTEILKTEIGKAESRNLKTEVGGRRTEGKG